MMINEIEIKNDIKEKETKKRGRKPKTKVIFGNPENLSQNQETIFIIILFIGVSLFGALFSVFPFPGYPFHCCNCLVVYDRDDI